MPNNIPGVVLPGDLEYKNTLLTIPKTAIYAGHKSRVFFLDILGQAYTNENAGQMARDMGGTVTLDYVTPDYLDNAGFKGLVVPTLQFTSKDEKKTIYNWEELAVDDYSACQGTFTEPITGSTMDAGAEITITVSSTAKFAEGRIINAFATNQQLRINTVLSSTTAKASLIMNSFTNDSSNFPGTDTQTTGVTIQDNAVWFVLAPAQAVGGYGILEPFARPTQRRNTFQTMAWEFEKTGHATAEDGSNATMSTSLSERKAQNQYMAYQQIDDSLWYARYGRGTYGPTGNEVYAMDGLRANIGSTDVITDYAAGTTLTLAKFYRFVEETTNINNPKDMAYLCDSFLKRVIEALGRASVTVFAKPGETAFGTTFVEIWTPRGYVKVFEMPDSKTLLDATVSGTDHTLYAINMKYIVPVVRAGRGLKWENDLRKDQTQDAKYDVLRGDISLATLQRARHWSLTGITG